jgi:hypothetical protein
MATMPEKKQRNCNAMNCITTSARHDFSDSMMQFIAARRKSQCVSFAPMLFARIFAA